MPQTRKAFIVMVGNFTLGVVTKKHPTKEEVKDHLNYINLIYNLDKNGFSCHLGSGSYFELKQKLAQFDDEIEFALECANKNKYMVKFLQEVNL